MSKHRTERRRDNAVQRIIDAVDGVDPHDSIYFIAKYISIDTLEVIAVKLEEKK